MKDNILLGIILFIRERSVKFFDPVYAHHSEPTDTELLQWLVETVDLVLGYNRWFVMGLVGFVIIIFPVVVVLLAKYRSR